MWEDGPRERSTLLVLLTVANTRTVHGTEQGSRIVLNRVNLELLRVFTLANREVYVYPLGADLSDSSNGLESLGAEFMC